MLNKERFLVASEARLGADSPITIPFEMEGVNAIFTLDVSASVAPTTLDVKLQEHDPATDTYVDVASGAFAQVGAVGTANERLAFTGLYAQKYQWVIAIAGTSYTFSIGGYASIS